MIETLRRSLYPLTVIVFLFIGGMGRAGDEARSVYSVDFATDLTITGVALAGVLVPYGFAGRWIKPSCPCLITEINGLDRLTVNNQSELARGISDVLVGLSVLGPVLANAFLVGTGPVFWEDVMVFSEALLISGALVSVTKVIVQRPLPRTYQGDPTLVGFAEGYRAFYSGHVTTAATALTAAAVTVGLRYDKMVWPWLAVAGVTTSVAALRILGGAHFITDTVVGAAVGVTVGVLVPVLHRRRKDSASSLHLVPSPGGATALWSSRF